VLGASATARLADALIRLLRTRASPWLPGKPWRGGGATLLEEHSEAGVMRCGAARRIIACWMSGWHPLTCECDSDPCSWTLAWLSNLGRGRDAWCGCPSGAPCRGDAHLGYSSLVPHAGSSDKLGEPPTRSTAGDVRARAIPRAPLIRDLFGHEQAALGSVHRASVA
jgi:hypothetical protein